MEAFEPLSGDGSQQENELETVEEGSLEPFLNKYDQTSVRHELIIVFQTFQI